ncbi:hypothetical protein EDD15DRAFT_16928 [Pisolithus albus]|nr:hypothetical protein EDD15DRAFT_16928 [Pisolithus albus]
MAGMAGCVLTGLTCTLDVGGMTESEWFCGRHRCICVDWAHLHSMFVVCQGVCDILFQSAISVLIGMGNSCLQDVCDLVVAVPSFVLTWLPQYLQLDL